VSSTAPSAAPPGFLRLKAHYFWVYAVFGCISPYLPVYLGDVKGLAPAQIGLILAVGQSGVLFLPPVMTYLADRYGLVAPLLVGLFSLNAVAMMGLAWASGFAACLLAVFLNQLANQPQVALTDGLFFSLQRQAGAVTPPFSAVRVWGTIGFIVPSGAIVVIYPALGLQVVPYVAILAAVLGMANARHLPRRLERAAAHSSRVPTLDAARLLLRPRVALFCGGMGLLIATNAAYYSFYPVYLTKQVGIEARWIGMIANVGVALEIGFMLAFERLRTGMGLRGLIVAGMAMALIRLGLLAFVPNATAAVALQVGHGLTIIGLLVAPVMYLNTLASDSFRNSVQGLYVMLVVGLFAVLGNYASGLIAETGLLVLYRAAFGVCALGGVLITISFLWPVRGRLAARA
jgi:PPP family 3-phenylpropionic acid transporter